METIWFKKTDITTPQIRKWLIPNYQLESGKTNELFKKVEYEIKKKCVHSYSTLIVHLCNNAHKRQKKTCSIRKRD